MKPLIDNDDLDATINAPERPQPGALPVIATKGESLRRKHNALVDQHAKAMERRENAIAKLRRADDKVRDLRKALARSTLRLKAERMLESLQDKDAIFQRLS